MSMDTEDILFDVIIYGKCSCGAVGGPEQDCPYDYDINNCISRCNCCEQCTQNCCDDI